jgi:proteasome lid subunit RPN8/RPN11
VTAVRLTAALRDEMVAHCLDGRPNEACGILAALNGRVVSVFGMSNASKSPVRYTLDSKEQLAVYRELDERGWDLGAVFHSHTRTAAYPSPTDVREATEDVPYVIVSLAADPPVARAFRIVKESWTATEGAIEEVPVVVEG